MAETTQAETTETTSRGTTEPEMTDTRGLRRSPAHHLSEAFAQGSAATAGRVGLAEVPFLAMAGIRVDPASEAGTRIGALTGGLPARCGEVTHGPEGIATLWLGPQEFLLVGTDPADGGAAATIAADLVGALAEDAGQVVDLSSNRTTFELSGPAARAVLEKSCSLDLHPRVFHTGTALATEVGGIPGLLWKTGEATFRLFPRASLADFLGRWLLDGMREFASVEVP